MLDDVPDFRVAHKTVAETYSETVRVQRAVAVVLRDLVHVRRIGGADGVALHVLLGGNAPSIVDAAKCDLSDRRTVVRTNAYVHEADLIFDFDHGGFELVVEFKKDLRGGLLCWRRGS